MVSDKVAVSFEAKFECLSFQCFGVLQFQDLKGEQFIAVDLFSEQAKVHQIGQQVGQKYSQQKGFSGVFPEEYFGFAPELQEKMIAAVFSQESEHEEHISAYEIAENDDDYRKEIDRTVFDFLLKHNPLVREEWDKKQQEIEAKQQMVQKMKQQIEQMRKIHKFAENLVVQIE